MFKFKCPNCGLLADLDESRIGQECPCEYCGKQVRITRAESPEIPQTGKDGPKRTVESETVRFEHVRVDPPPVSFAELVRKVSPDRSTRPNSAASSTNLSPVESEEAEEMEEMELSSEHFQSPDDEDADSTTPSLCEDSALIVPQKRKRWMPFALLVGGVLLFGCAVFFAIQAGFSGHSPIADQSSGLSTPAAPKENPRSPITEESTPSLISTVEPEETRSPESSTIGKENDNLDVESAADPAPVAADSDSRTSDPPSATEDAQESSSAPRVHPVSGPSEVASVTEPLPVSSAVAPSPETDTVRKSPLPAPSPPVSAPSVSPQVPASTKAATARSSPVVGLRTKQELIPFARSVVNCQGDLPIHVKPLLAEAVSLSKGKELSKIPLIVFSPKEVDTESFPVPDGLERAAKEDDLLANVVGLFAKIGAWQFGYDFDPIRIVPEGKTIRDTLNDLPSNPESCLILSYAPVATQSGKAEKHRILLDAVFLSLPDSSLRFQDRCVSYFSGGFGKLELARKSLNISDAVLGGMFEKIGPALQGAFEGEALSAKIEQLMERSDCEAIRPSVTAGSQSKKATLRIKAPGCRTWIQSKSGKVLCRMEMILDANLLCPPDEYTIFIENPETAELHRAKGRCDANQTYTFELDGIDLSAYRRRAVDSAPGKDVSGGTPEKSAKTRQAKFVLPNKEPQASTGRDRDRVHTFSFSGESITLQGRLSSGGTRSVQAVPKFVCKVKCFHPEKDCSGECVNQAKMKQDVQVTFLKSLSSGGGLPLMFNVAVRPSAGRGSVSASVELENGIEMMSQLAQ